MEPKVISIEETEKSQMVRIADMAVVTPFLAYAGYVTPNKYVKYGLFALAAATFLYNGRNFISNHRKLKIAKNVKPASEVEKDQGTV